MTFFNPYKDTDITLSKSSTPTEQSHSLTIEPNEFDINKGVYITLGLIPRPNNGSNIVIDHDLEVLGVLPKGIAISWMVPEGENGLSMLERRGSGMWKLYGYPLTGGEYRFKVIASYYDMNNYSVGHMYSIADYDLGVKKESIKPIPDYIPPFETSKELTFILNGLPLCIMPEVLQAVESSIHFDIDLYLLGNGVGEKTFSIKKDDPSLFYVNINKKTGRLSGVIKGEGVYKIKVECNDSYGNFGERNYLLQVREQPKLTPSKSNFKVVYGHKTKINFTLSGALGSVRYTISSDNNTTSFDNSFNSSTGELIIEKQNIGNYNLVITAEDEKSRKFSKKYTLDIVSKYEGELKDLGVWPIGTTKSFPIDIPNRAGFGNPKVEIIYGIQGIYIDDEFNITGTPIQSEWKGEKSLIIIDILSDQADIETDIVRETYQVYLSTDRLKIYPLQLPPLMIDKPYNPIQLDTPGVSGRLKYSLINATDIKDDIGLLLDTDGHIHSDNIKKTKLTDKAITVRVTTDNGDTGTKIYNLPIMRDISFSSRLLPDGFLHKQYKHPIFSEKDSASIIPNDFKLILSRVDNYPLPGNIEVIREVGTGMWYLKVVPVICGEFVFSISMESSGLNITSQTFTLRIYSTLAINSTPSIIPDGIEKKSYPITTFYCSIDNKKITDVTYQVITIPDGLYFDKSKGMLYGNPKFKGMTPFVISAMDENHDFYTYFFAIKVFGPPTVIDYKSIILSRMQRTRVQIILKEFYGITEPVITGLCFIILTGDTSVNEKRDVQLSSIDNRYLTINAIIENGIPFIEFTAKSGFDLGVYKLHYILTNRFGESLPGAIDVRVK